MALSSRSIITLNEAKAYLNISTGGTAWDSTLETWIDWVSGKFEEETRNKVNATAITEILDGDGTGFLETTYFPVLSIYGDTEAERLANLQKRASPISDWEDILTSESYIFIEETDATKIQLLNYVFPAGVKNIRVKYWAGYSAANVPTDIKKVILEALATMWKESNLGKGLLNVSSETANVAGASISYRDFGPRWDAVVARRRKYL